MKPFIRLLTTSLAMMASLSLLSRGADAQVTLPPVISGDVVNSIKGTTVNLSTQTGSKSSVSFGSSTTFGASSSINASSGANTSSETILKLNTTGNADCITGGCVNSSIGGTDGVTSANITNLRSTTDSDQSSSGNVNLQGIKASNTLTINGDSSIFKSGASATSSSLSVNANAGSNALINTNTNVDINTTNFASSFQQAF